jgi:hypothetical protein
VLDRLETKHHLLRTLILLELKSNALALYPGTTAAEARRLADFSESAGWARFGVLRNLALHTPQPMDHWYLRAVTRGAPNRVDPDDALTVAGFTDSLDEVVHKLSIDSFWSILERPTRYVSPWVHAFAKKRDPRLLPIILRNLEPENVDESAADALAHYRGMPVAEAALIRLAEDPKIGADDEARAAVRKSLRRLGTPGALAAARQLGLDEDETEPEEPVDE